jgi:hypothetical protein
MKRFLISVAIATALGIPVAHATTTEQLKACELSWREKNKTDKAAAPEGYRPIRSVNARQAFIAECLSK